MEPTGKYEEQLEPTGPKGTTHKQCTCRSIFQDEQYGKGIRVHNRMSRTVSRSSQWRCTVCAKEK